MIKPISLENNIKALVKNKEYSIAINNLKKEIINHTVFKIKQKDSTYTYTNIFNLIDKSEEVLDSKYNTQLKKLYYLSKEDCCEEYEIYQLLDIYSNVRKWKKWRLII